ncbi:hypothetical protein GLYMA_11G035966v4 [Glycine max]|nr:hypothetical protein GLYMA_11G035966v4 [Glycine max]KAH1157438.1 hypothetical protein GYH30_029927 [Glycine max]
MVFCFNRGIFCVLADTLIKGEVYSSYIQVFISTFYLFSLLLDLYFLLVFQFFLFFSSCNMLGCTLLIVSLYWHLGLIFMHTLLSLTYLDFKILQEHLAPSGYLKLPNAIPDYLENCRFLPVLNNEIPDKRNSTYKERFSSLQNLVLIMLEHDTVLIPRETSWFGYYPDGYFKPVLPPQSI